MQGPHKYARIERERQFLVDRFPSGDIVRTRHITDRYIDGTLLRLREQTDEGGEAIFKLTQKVPAAANGAQFDNDVRNLFGLNHLIDLRSREADRPCEVSNAIKQRFDMTCEPPH